MKKLLVSLAHGFIMLALHIIYLNSTWIVPIEEEMVVLFTKIQTFFFSPETKSGLLFINTSEAVKTTYTENAGTVAVTDRMKLDTLFNFLADNNNQHKYLLCDIRFTDKTQDDSFLNRSVQRLDKYICPSHLNVFDEEEPSVINVNTGIADYVTYEALFSKMLLSYNNRKSLPLKMYEECSDKKLNYKQKNLGLCDHSILSWMPNSLFPKFYITKEKEKANEMSLNAATAFIRLQGKAFYDNMIHDKIIVIGDFDNDVEPTAIGRLPGTLILLNAFLTLKEDRYNAVTGIIFLFISYFAISYYFFYFSDLKQRYCNHSYARFVRAFFEKRRLFLLLIIISFIAVLLGVRSTVLPFLLYFHLIEKEREFFTITKK